MDIALAIVQLAEVAKANGGAVPIEIANKICEYRLANPDNADTHSNFITECSIATANKALYGY